MLTWDAAKAADNLAKHGVAFADAGRFEWETAIVSGDNRADYGEARWIAVGHIGARLHVLVFALRDGDVRVISLRKANRREGERYAEKAG